MHRCTMHNVGLDDSREPSVVVPRFYIGSYTYEYRCRLFHPNGAAAVVIHRNISYIRTRFPAAENYAYSQ